MTRLLVSCAKDDFGPRLDAHVAQVRSLVKKTVKVVSCAEIDWKRVQREQGSWEGAYRWTARSFDVVVVVETEEGTLSRGVFQIAEEMQAVGKRVLVLRNGGLALVRELRLTGCDNWRSNYGAVVDARIG